MSKKGIIITAITVMAVIIGTLVGVTVKELTLTPQERFDRVVSRLKDDEPSEGLEKVKAIISDGLAQSGMKPDQLAIEAGWKDGMPYLTAHVIVNNEYVCYPVTGKYYGIIVEMICYPEWNVTVPYDLWAVTARVAGGSIVLE